ncbi:MAG: hypothetical protein HYR72_08980 [Deltaproteobacteria bacterium]|nr:hypothetical protein [Deltaproteobacteria bacterium]MBI3388890.1 hypothetical protein [Deltaproteobacteria bacterium]
MMRLACTLTLTLALAGMAVAQTAAPVQFGYFKCSCGPTSPALSPTPNFLGQAAVTLSWSGTIYALSDVDARLKAKNACVAENRGSSLLCDGCRCSK